MCKENIKKILDDYSSAVAENSEQLSQIRDDTNNKLQGFLSEREEYSIFDGDKIHALPSGGTVLSLSFLVYWMMNKATRISSNDVLKQLDDYINKKNYKNYALGILDGLNFSSVTMNTKPYDLGVGVFLCPIIRLPEEVHFQLEGVTKIGIQAGTGCVLFTEFESTPAFFENTDPIESDTSLLPNEYKKIDDAFLCLSLVRSGGLSAQIGKKTFASMPQMPINLNNSYSTGSNRNPRMDAPIIELEMKKARNLNLAFSEMSEDAKSHLRVSMHKFSQYTSEIDLVQGAIDLRVAFESFYQTGLGQQKRQNTAERAKFYSDESAEERESIFRLVRDFYGEASHAVHTGEIQAQSGENISKAARVLNVAICKRILSKENNIDWEELRQNVNT